MFVRRPTFVTAALVLALLVTGTGGAMALTGQGPFSRGPDPVASAARHQYPEVCREMRRANRAEERAQRAENRAQERRLRGRTRREVRRANRRAERNFRRANRRAERECRR